VADLGRRLQIVSGEKGKGRSFTAEVLAMASANVWDKHESNATKERPAFVMLACQQEEALPVLANLRAGHGAFLSGEGVYGKGVAFETLKSSRYRWGSQRIALPRGQGAVVLTGRVPGVTLVDPGPQDPAADVNFLIVPPRARLEQETARLPAREMLEYGAALLRPQLFRDGGERWNRAEVPVDGPLWRFMPAMALWFCACLDRRTGVPILPDPLFQVRLYLAALYAGLASWSKHDGQSNYGSDVRFGRRGVYLSEWGYAGSGLAPGVACSTSQERLRGLLVQEVRAWGRDRVLGSTRTPAQLKLWRAEGDHEEEAA